jgi:putative membrane protein
MHWNYGIRYGFFNNLMGGQIFMWILVLVIVFLVLYFFTDLFKKNTVTSWKVEKESTAVDILKERFAKGEINEEEFEKKLKILNETK